MPDFGWNYPQGVSGNEYAISGADYEKESTEPCPRCACNLPDCPEHTLLLIEQGYHGERWLTCPQCDYTRDLESLEDYNEAAAEYRQAREEDLDVTG